MKRMLINMVDVEESRIAIVSDGGLEDLYVESAGREQVKGNIYKGVVVSIAKSLQACFVDFGGSRAGFLPIDEIDPKFYRAADGSRSASHGSQRPPIQDVIRVKQELLVQVVKEEIGTKGASLTTYISLPGRYLVLMPGSEEVGISRKIDDDSQRKRLREIIDSFDVPEGVGVIVRTAGIDKTKTELVKDFNYLRRLWTAIEDATAHCKAPALIYQERDIVTRAIRDHFSNDIQEIIVDNKEVVERALEFMKTFLPRHQRILQLFEEKKPLFSHFKIEDQIDTIYQHQVRLPSGGSIVIDPTEALVSIDVNSAKSTQERTAEETALRTNMEAAEEVARQLRLRDLGGIIVIDFIDMKDSKHKRQVERCLKNSLKVDKARMHVGKISKLGLVELSRQRLKPAIMDRNYLLCPACNGIGMVKSTEAKALILLRKVQSTAADGNLYMVRGHLPIDVYSYLLNKKRDELARIERDCGVRLDFALRTGFDEQVFNPDCLELFTRIPDDAAASAHRSAAVRDSAILADLQKEAAVGHDRARSEIDLPDHSELPDFDPTAADAEGALAANPPAPVSPPHGGSPGRERDARQHQRRDGGRSRDRHPSAAQPGQKLGTAREPGAPRRVQVRTGLEGSPDAAAGRPGSQPHRDHGRDAHAPRNDRDRGQHRGHPQGRPSAPAGGGHAPVIEGGPERADSAATSSLPGEAAQPYPERRDPVTGELERGGRRRRRRRGRGGRGGLHGQPATDHAGAPLVAPGEHEDFAEHDPAQTQLFPVEPGEVALGAFETSTPESGASGPSYSSAGASERLGRPKAPSREPVAAPLADELDGQPRLPLMDAGEAGPAAEDAAQAPAAGADHPRGRFAGHRDHAPGHRAAHPSPAVEASEQRRNRRRRRRGRGRGAQAASAPGPDGQP
ncbi:MAG: Rne/Rng family ribonuclease [Candidatus Wallbacteria bacterium]|nr:Rne/Rng family ribonuclease [Candidatus Wallbacteria bacterium]